MEHPILQASLVDVQEKMIEQAGQWPQKNSLPTWSQILGKQFGKLCEMILNGDDWGARQRLLTIAAVALSAYEEIDSNAPAECGCVKCVTCGECSACDSALGCPDCNGAKCWPSEP